MDVGWSHRMPIQEFQQHTSRAIRWQRIRRRLQHIEVIFPIRIRLEFPSQIIIRLVFWVLKVVFPVGRRLPDIDDRTWNALAGCEIGDLAVHESWLCLRSWVLDDASAELPEWGIW
jgi:hypothetical protein